MTVVSFLIIGMLLIFSLVVSGVNGGGGGGGVTMLAGTSEAKWLGLRGEGGLEENI